MIGGVKVGFAAMGLGDLFDEGETGAVGSEAVVSTLGLWPMLALVAGASLSTKRTTWWSRANPPARMVQPVDCGARSCSGGW